MLSYHSLRIIQLKEEIQELEQALEEGVDHWLAEDHESADEKLKELREELEVLT